MAYAPQTPAPRAQTLKSDSAAAVPDQGPRLGTQLVRQRMLDASPQARAQQQLQARIDASPRQAMQARMLNLAAGATRRTSPGPLQRVAGRPANAAGGGAVMQLAKITDDVGVAKNWVESTGVTSNFVHFNIQMSGDSRLAVASVGHAKKNETRDDITNGLIVSVPKDTDDGGTSPYAWVNNKLYGALASAGVGADDTQVYATESSNPHQSRTESLGHWRGWHSSFYFARGGVKTWQGWNVYQTGGVADYVAKYETDDDNSFKSSLEQDYGVKDAEGAEVADGNAKSRALGAKLATYNVAGNVVLWFKGDPTLSGSMNSLQTAKTEHWLGASAGKRIIDAYGADKVVIAGTVSPGYKAILEKSIANADQYFTVDKLQAADLTEIGKQYGFFYRYGPKMTHFGGRSGNLEPLAALGLNTIYFEEKGSGQAGRDLHIGKDNKIKKTVIDGVTSSAGAISKGVSWINAQTGAYRTGSAENANADQRAYYDKLINRWMGYPEADAVSTETRKSFATYFLTGQDKNKTMAQNSEKFQENMVFDDATHTPEEHEEQVLSASDLEKLVGGLTA